MGILMKFEKIRLLQRLIYQIMKGSEVKNEEFLG